MGLNDNKRLTARIPTGWYCYSHDGNKRYNCPYWYENESKPIQNNGYCSYLGIGDWETKGTLIWDQVKHCGIKDYRPDYD